MRAWPPLMTLEPTVSPKPGSRSARDDLTVRTSRTVWLARKPR